MAKTSESRSAPEQKPAATAWLYNIDSDFSQANDLAEANPQKRRELQELWWVEAARTCAPRSTFSCRLPFDFTGRIGKLTVELKAK